MASEVNTVTIYEINGVKYTGQRKIEIRPHERFLSFVRLRVDRQEYSVASDDLMRAVDRSVSRLPAPQDSTLPAGPANLINDFVEEQAVAKLKENRDMLLR